jgi:hypothetical protein
LFHDESLSEYLSRQRDYAVRAVGRIDSLEELPARESELQKLYRVSTPRLMRSEARFEINDTADGITASVTVPFHGHVRLFSVKPDDDGHRGIPAQATIDDERRGSKYEPTISLVTTFPTATTAHQVKIWAKGEVDTVEAWLSDMAPEVDAYNGTIDEFVGSRIEQRRAVLATVETPRAELENGI